VVTIKDIANVCNVSYSTVSRVLNGKTVRPSLRNDKIITTAKALGYNPNNIAVQLAKGDTKLLGLLIPDVANPHYSEITKYVEDAALTAGYKIFLCNTDWDVCKEVMYRDALLEQRVAGMIVMPVCDKSHAIFRGLDLPVVILGSHTNETVLHSVVVDNNVAVGLAVDQLIQHGFSKLVFISRKPRNITATEREQGFCRSLRSHSLRVDAGSTVDCGESTNIESACSVARVLLNRDIRPDGIVAFNDFIALGVIEAIEEAGLIVGKDIGVVGFDNILFSRLNKISLTSVAPSHSDMAEKAVRIIVESRKERVPVIRNEVVEPYIYVRSSSGF